LLIEDDTAMARTVDLLLQGEGWRAPISHPRRYIRISVIVV